MRENTIGYYKYFKVSAVFFPSSLFAERSFARLGLFLRPSGASGAAELAEGPTGLRGPQLLLAVRHQSGECGAAGRNSR